MEKKQFHQLVWDYKLSLEEFEQILTGEKEEGWFTREWAIARVLENLNYYQARDLVDWDFVRENWSQIKLKIFNKAIQEGYEYLLQKQPLSASG